MRLVWYIFSWNLKVNWFNNFAMLYSTFLSEKIDYEVSYSLNTVKTCLTYNIFLNYELGTNSLNALIQSH